MDCWLSGTPGKNHKGGKGVKGDAKEDNDEDESKEKEKENAKDSWNEKVEKKERK